MTRAFIKQLRRAVGDENVSDRQGDLLTYAYDASLTRHEPELVVLPTSTAQVQEVCTLCMDASVPLTPRGAATSLSGGPIPVRGGVALALTRMDEILELDLENRCALVQAGVVNTDLQQALEPHGYFYAPNPASETVSTLGGNVAMNAGGPHCLKYGVTVNHVLGLRVVMADGQLLDIGGKSARWQSADFAGLITGSEGTLGIITEMLLRILPMSESVTTVLAVFEDVEQASQAASDIIAAGMIPAALELMDRPLIQAVQRSLEAGYPQDAGAVLIIEVDGLEATAHRELNEIQNLCRMNEVIRFDWARDEETRELLWRGRKGTTGAVAHIAPSKLCSDITVPRHALPLAINEIIRIGERHLVPVGSLAHAGDGNLHPQLMFDPRDREQVKRVLAADDEVTQLAMDLGGVLTGEHGIGDQKRKWMTRMFAPAELRLMYQLKDLLDPLGILNPGKVLPDEAGKHHPPEPNLPPGDFETAAPELAWYIEGVLTPPHEAELANLLALAAREGVHAEVRGGGTASSAVPDGAVAVSTQALNHLTEHDHTNLTVTVGAGMKLTELRSIVAAEAQMVPLFAAEPEEATVGGVVAAHDQGPRGLGYWRCRDLVTGVTVALSTGEVVTFGGKCVKDVAGYDLKKLFIGSRAAFGVITELTLRTLPLPEDQHTFVFVSDDPAAVARAAASVLATPLSVTAIEAAGGATLSELCQSPELVDLGSHAWALAMETSGMREAVEETGRRVEGITADAGLSQARALDPDAADELWRALASLRGGMPPETRGATLALPPADALGAGAMAADLAAECGLTIMLRASPSRGRVRLRVHTEAGDEQLVRFVAGLRDLAPEGHGSLRTAGLPFEGEEGPVARLARQIKGIFDPAGVLPPVLGVAM